MSAICLSLSSKTIEALLHYMRLINARKERIMSAQDIITINNGATTPVAKAFNPKGAKTAPDRTDMAIWKNQDAPSQVGFVVLSEKHTPVNVNGMEKFRYTIDVPTLESPASGGAFAPPPTRAFGTIAVVEVWAHARASEQELKDIVAYVKNFTATAYFSNAIVKREAAW